MSNTITINLTLEPEGSVVNSFVDLNVATLDISLQCPECLDTKTGVGMWGTYKAAIDTPRRYRCYDCGKTFNIAKIKYWKDKISEIIWKIAQLTIEDRISVHSLAEKWDIPKTTLYVLIGQIKMLLSDAFEQAKIMYFRQNPEKTKVSHSFRAFYYDEGFLRLWMHKHTLSLL